MAAPNVAKIQRVPGRLIWNPTDLGNAEPYGGTYLGVTRAMEFEPGPKLRQIKSESLGSIKDVIYCGEEPKFYCVLRYPDSDALTQAAFKAIASGSQGIHWLFRPGGTTANTRAGTSLESKGGKLLFSPRADDEHDMVLMYHAIPAIAETARLQHSIGVEYGLALVFYGAPDSSGRVYDTGRKANLVL